MSDSQKTLTGVTVGLSIAATSEMLALGVNTAEVTCMTASIARRFSAQGVGVASAHEPLCQACLCIGGRTEGVDGCLPSVIEDALATLDAARPLYLSGVIGGAAQHLIAALRQALMPTNFGRLHSAGADGPKVIWSRLKAIGVAGLARQNGLSAAENEALFHATDMAQIADAVMLGLTRLRGAGRL